MNGLLRDVGAAVGGGGPGCTMPGPEMTLVPSGSIVVMTLGFGVKGTSVADCVDGLLDFAGTEAGLLDDEDASAS